MNADPNLPNKALLTPLHLSCMYGAAINIVKNLLLRAATPNVMDAQVRMEGRGDQ